MNDIADLAFKETEDFRIDFVKRNVRSRDDAVALASMFLYQGILILRATGGNEYAAQVMYSMADFEVSESIEKKHG